MATKIVKCLKNRPHYVFGVNGMTKITKSTHMAAVSPSTSIQDSVMFNHNFNGISTSNLLSAEQSVDILNDPWINRAYEDTMSEISNIQNKLLSHTMYSQLTDIPSLHILMSSHVFQVLIHCKCIFIFHFLFLFFYNYFL